MKTLEEMRELHKQQKLNLLTIDVIPSLIGKKICTIYFGYAGQDHVDEFVVKGIESEWDFASKEVMEDGRTRSEYWNSYMSKAQKEEAQNTMCVIRDVEEHERQNTYIRCDVRNERFFWCSDIDRWVFYTEVDDERTK